MGFLDTLLGGRRKLKAPAPDRLFAMTTAQVQLDAGLGLKPKGEAGIAFQQVATADFKQILSAAEESATRIVERARATTQHQISRSNHLWREVQAEVARFASWREQVDPVIRSVQSKVEGVREHIEDVPEKIRQALAPMADSISAIDADLAELAAACTPPLLLTPTGLNPETDPEEWTIGDDVPFRSENSGSGEPNADHGDTDHLAG